MPTRRMIEPSLWQSESMGRLTIRQRLMFIGMFSNADDQGRLRSSAPIIRSIILPFDEVSISEIEEDIQAIHKEGYIILYSINGSRYAQIVNWWKYQTPQWAYKSLIPKPDGWSDRLRYRHGGEVITENWQKISIDQDSIDQDSIVKAKGKGKGIGKRLGKKGSNGAEKEPRPRDPLFDAIAKVTCTDPATAGPSIGKVESSLKAANPPYTPDEVIKFGQDWPDWKDKPPTLWQLREQIGIVRSGNGKSVNHANNPTHSKEPQYTPEQLAAADLINARRAEKRAAAL